MAIAVDVTWTAKPGDEARVAARIAIVQEASRAEPGMLFFQAHVSATNSRVFHLYELFRDEKARKAHGESEHVRVHVVGYIFDLLESRSSNVWETVGPVA